MARIEYKNDGTRALEEAEGSAGRLNVSSRSDSRSYYNSQQNKIISFAVGPKDIQRETLMICQKFKGDIYILFIGCYVKEVDHGFEKQEDMTDIVVG